MYARQIGVYLNHTRNIRKMLETLCLRGVYTSFQIMYDKIMHDLAVHDLPVHTACQSHEILYFFFRQYENGIIISLCIIIIASIVRGNRERR